MNNFKNSLLSLVSGTELVLALSIVASYILVFLGLIDHSTAQPWQHASHLAHSVLTLIKYALEKTLTQK